MPDLSRSTLMDHIDYELDGIKVNEGSLFILQKVWDKQLIIDNIVSSSEINNCHNIQDLHKYNLTSKKDNSNNADSNIIRDIVFKSLA